MNSSMQPNSLQLRAKSINCPLFQCLYDTGKCITITIQVQYILSTWCTGMYKLPELRRISCDNLVSNSLKRSSSFLCDESSRDGTLCADAVRHIDTPQSSHVSSTLHKDYNPELSQVSTLLGYTKNILDT